MKYQTFEIVSTRAEAVSFCAAKNATATPYMRKNKPAHFTEWSSADGREFGFICWYYI